jgi:hypothetical protein
VNVARGTINFPLSLSQKGRKSQKSQKSSMADHLVPNQVLGFFEFQGERERGSFLFSKACKSLYRRRFKKIEDAPLAAYGIYISLSDGCIRLKHRLVADDALSDSHARAMSALWPVRCIRKGAGEPAPTSRR